MVKGTYLHVGVIHPVHVCLYVCNNNICTNCRLAYSVWMLESIVDKFPRGVKLHCMYDIACVLTKHLEVWRISNSTFCL